MLNGIYPPLPTPFHDDGSLALDGLRVNVERLNATGLSGYVALGSNSEAVHVSPDEASQVFTIVRKVAASDKQVIGGTGQFSTHATIAMTKRAADAGCDAALIVTPFYYKNAMTADALRTHYHTIADQSPIPILIYNVPANTSLNVASSIVAEIAQHPNVIGIKDSAGDINQLAETVRLTMTRSKRSAQRAPDAERRTRRERSEAEATPGGPPPQSGGYGQSAAHPSTSASLRSASALYAPGFEVLSGNYGAFLPGLTFGIVGAILAVSNIAPNECVLIYDLFKQGRVSEAGELHLRMLPVARAVTTQFGVPGLKVAMDMLGYFGGSPRLPLLPLGASARVELEKILREAELLAN